MIRTLLWGCLYLLTLGAATIDVRYRDGLHIHFKGWFKGA